MNSSEAEYWDLFDENRVFTGAMHRRGDPVPDGSFHLVVHSWIMDPSGLFLISQRQKGRPYELKWERTGGSVLAGESSLGGAVREAMEELGVDLTDAPCYFIKSVKRPRFHDFYDAWLFIVPKEDVTVKTDPEEVHAFMWATYDEMKNLKENNELVKSSRYFDEVYDLFRRIRRR